MGITILPVGKPHFDDLFGKRVTQLICENLVGDGLTSSAAHLAYRIPIGFAPGGEFVTIIVHGNQLTVHAGSILADCLFLFVVLEVVVMR